jgi:hypothetical protein
MAMMRARLATRHLQGGGVGMIARGTTDAICARVAATFCATPRKMWRFPSYNTGDIVPDGSRQNFYRSELSSIQQMMKQCPQISISLILACGLALSACNQRLQARGEPAASIPTSEKTISWEDADNDGLPDAAELHSFDDRRNFRRWFAAIAELQFYRLSEQWNAEQRDCAGLVRFAWREALRKHDRAWFQAMGGEDGSYEAIAPDLRAYTLDRSLLGEKLFRADFGSFQPGDLSNGKLSEFADARSLKNYNATFVSRDRRQAKTGDLLFYHQPWVQKYSYHVMIFLGAARHASEGANDWVVYHTGAAPNDKGEVKKVRLAVLDQHPDKRWRPNESNRNFLGFYRLKILE